jgi:hypothetical protein
MIRTAHSDHLNHAPHKKTKKKTPHPYVRIAACVFADGGSGLHLIVICNDIAVAPNDPTGQLQPAQGSALGIVHPVTIALKGQKQNCSNDSSALAGR